MNVMLFLIFGSCCFNITLSVKILNVKNLKEEEVFNVTIKNPPEYTGSKISVCWWVKTLYRAYYDFLGSGVGTPGLKLFDYYGHGKSLYINEYQHIDISLHFRIRSHRGRGTYQEVPPLFKIYRRTTEFHGR